MTFRQRNHLCQPEKMIRDYERYNLKANNIMVGDTIGPQRQRVVLGLVGLDDPYLMNI